MTLNNRDDKSLVVSERDHEEASDSPSCSLHLLRCVFSRADGSERLLSVCLLSGLSRLPVQRPGPRRGGGARCSGSSSAAGAGGHQLLLPPSVRPAHVHHAQALQQENLYQRQEQRAGGGQSSVSVSSSAFACMRAVDSRSVRLSCSRSFV